MAGRADSTLEICLTSIKDALVANATFNAQTAVLSLRDEQLTDPPGDQYVLIRPGRIKPARMTDQGLDEGCLLRADIYVTLWTMNVLDRLSQDTQVLTSATLGVYAAINDIMDALQGYDDDDGAGNSIFAEQMRLIDVSEPKRVNEGNEEWVRVQMKFELNMTLIVS